MCGIAGSVGDGAGSVVVEAQLDLLDHRGPDSRGIFERGAACIGQTRLAVIDLVTGDPPITDEEGLVAAVLNGEIYNFSRLRRQLERRGHQLKSEGDTEVLAHLAEDVEPGELCRQLEGMFAFAVWDDRRQRLVLGRDRLGKKPLYYWTGPARFVFASEIKALMAHPWVGRQLQPGAIDAYLTFGYVPSPRTFFAGVKSVPAGHVAVLGADHSLRLERYWEPPAAHRMAGGSPSRAATAAHLRQLLAAAVAKRMVADVPMGAFLSGGVDSSCVVALMAELSAAPVATFTIGFEHGQGFDERPYARMVAKRFSTDHHEFVVRPDATELIESLVFYHDQPFGDSSALPTYLLSQLTRQHVTVALCGDGGDEAFAGYERFAAAVALSWLQHLPRPAREMLASAAGALPASALGGRAPAVRRLLCCRDLPVHRALLSWASYLPLSWRDRLLPGASDWGLEAFDELWATTQGADLVTRLQLVTLASYLLDDLLPKVDRTSMAHGLEVRSPLLDTDVVGYALALPASQKLRGMSLKRALKAAMADDLPTEVLRRPKKGFGLPLAHWFRTDLRSYVEGNLGAGARVRAHLRPEALDAMVGEHMAGRDDHGHGLWSLLTLECFLRREGW